MTPAENIAQGLPERLLHLLAEPAYGLPDLRFLRDRLQRAHLERPIIDARRHRVQAHAPDGSAVPGAFVLTSAAPQVIDFLPRLRDGVLQPVAPTIILGPEEDDVASLPCVLHELCHLLALGPYEPGEDGLVHHVSGCMRYTFRAAEDGTLQQVGVRGSHEDNELANDLVAWHLLGRLQPGGQGTRRALEPPPPVGAAIQAAGAFGWPAFVGAYFRGEAPALPATPRTPISCRRLRDAPA